MRHTLIAAIGSLGFAGVALAVPVLNPANGHYYERVEAGNITWDAAKASAASLSYLGLPGQLVVLDTATYTDERDFVFRNVYAPGVQSSRTYWIGASREVNDLISHQEGWNWIDGTAVPTLITSGWNIDFNEGDVREGANFFRTDSDTPWDYDALSQSGLTSGFLVEYGGVPEPVSIGMLPLAGLMAIRRRSIGR